MIEAFIVGTVVAVASAIGGALVVVGVVALASKREESE